MSTPRSEKLIVVAAIAAAYSVAFVPLLFLGPEGFWLAKLLFVCGTPFLALAASCGLLFATNIKSHPWKWSITAAAIVILTSTAALWYLTNSMVGALSLFPALASPLAFRVTLRLFDR